MRRALKIMGRGVLGLGLGLGVAAAALFAFGPYEPVDLEVSFDDSQLDGGVDAYFQQVEAGFSDITPGVEKRVVWAGVSEAKTPVSVLYVHGFSATSEEIRPVPDRVAAALGANLVFTRLAGHGRGSAAMAEPTVQDWMQDVAEALAVARHVGERVVVMSTSTGGTLMALAELDPELKRAIAAQIFVSPNFALQGSMDKVLSLPAARYWGPIVAGAERAFEPANTEHGRYWTTTYPTVALMPMAAAVQTVQKQDWSRATTPALFWFSPEDWVVDASVTADLAAQWGGDSTVGHPDLSAGDDPYSHVIAGDIMSPHATDQAVRAMVDWLQSEGIE
ncbi:Thermostable monoacylglycerol lipase [Tritonibacter multivorans]|uniref:Thermostable monoacylglycerol lipase n=1 Tax=Tritonibacter multivorans TaxID=928856 RepID=A0A0P1GXD2_9RHOB|nr:alpha/beta hydrolase [Tritonibacter multivorans]MDA7420651.1 alpha/beta fold hydrolase [Tritonibacter multivorans]CUH81197.1 Thermostable monoacylglycerol lipase [Tritonibacter multivorans]SFC30576.1 Serine aminopeptidase, S33 [Tritonibacter multivorans]